MILVMPACNLSRETVVQERNDIFSKELDELKEFFRIPGLSVLVLKGNHTIYENYSGLANLEKKIPVDSLTIFPMASLTKIFTGVLIMQLVEEGKLSLEEPVNKYVSNINIGDSIKIKHVLSHTSQGVPGSHFYYSDRYGWLTNVIEKASGTDFGNLMQQKILTPLGLSHTYLLKDSTQILNANYKYALPYFYDGKVKNGELELGYSASKGIISTVQDLGVFSKALDEHRLISGSSWLQMCTPYKPGAEYGYGIFSQEFLGEKLIWGYGQYNSYSSLFLKVPARDLTLVIAANNNLLSDPARLIYGNVTYSLFALSFLKNYVFGLEEETLLEHDSTLKSLEKRLNKNNSEFYLRKLLAQSIAESFMANYQSSKTEISKNILTSVFKWFPEYLSYGDLALIHNMVILKDASLQRTNTVINDFDKQIEHMGRKLLATDEYNPYANFYMAYYFQGKNKMDSTRKYYEKIINAPNFSRNWYSISAEEWIGTH